MRHNNYIPEHWAAPLAGVITIFLLSGTIFYQSWLSIIAIWYRSDTFAHGFLVLPISLWLIWSRRHSLNTLVPKPAISVILLTFVSGLVWLMAKSINVLVIEQYAVVALLLSAVWVMLGHQTTWYLIYPLLFLFLMVPVGEELVPPLMEYTATFTVWMLRFSGISVYREGLYFTLPSGDWSVVEACSGIRYLIASITLGLVYAYLNYQLLWKRCLFILLSIVVPVVANGFRAYLIVMTGHYSNMTLAVGADHLIYGGVFFGLVMLILFYLGSFWRDAPQALKTDRGNVEDNHLKPLKQNWIVPVLSVVILYSVWPLLHQFLQQQQVQRVSLFGNYALERQGSLQPIEDPWYWQPDFQGVQNSNAHYFSDGVTSFGVYQADFGIESQSGAELVNSQNQIISHNDESWKQVSQTEVTLVDSGRAFTVNEYILRGQASDLLIYQWYQIGRMATGNKYLAKLFQLKKYFMADTKPEVSVVVLTETPRYLPEKGRTTLTTFAQNWLTGIR